MNIPIEAVPTDLAARLGEAVSLSVVGMLVVFSALCLTAIVIAVLGKCFGCEETGIGGGEAPPVDVHLKVIVAAAAATVLGRRVRVRGIEKFGVSGGPGNG